MHSISIKDILTRKPLGEKIEIKGWLKTRRDSKDFSFLEINDGSCLANIQVIAASALKNYQDTVLHLHTGCSLLVQGVLNESPAKGQEVELHADLLEVYGWAEPDKYPLQKKRHSFEFLRSIAHLRPRTNSIGAITRIRSSLSFGVHKFFQERGFVQVHTPIITTSDCEGAGEMFRVSIPLHSDMEKQNESAPVGDFFGKPANLTVSGQLQAEVYALALGKVYTFGPTFRAENSNTSRHLAEFWMIEPEMAFCDLAENMTLAESFLKYLIGYVLENNKDDIQLFAKFIDKELFKKLKAVLNNPFARTTYSDAVAILEKSGKVFDFPVRWGVDFQAEHEQFLCEEVFNGPVFVTDYPREIKPFYMRLNNDNQTVAAMDLLLPGIGEIIGGSQREERYDFLVSRMKELNLDLEEYSWYLDLRNFGTVPHSGFGLGFERFLQFITSMNNIRDVIPFPRTPGSASY
ncbi:MAG: asparagine--tRNA ligase [Deltaproteobacteria bacterium]|jgi:asparaginyl-tRNA synthetase|nr:asparagine--tRNA ligase [Deltaproteobacteria bacterium]